MAAHVPHVLVVAPRKTVNLRKIDGREEPKLFRSSPERVERVGRNREVVTLRMKIVHRKSPS